jgi:hypothetical protein
MQSDVLVEVFAMGAYGFFDCISDTEEGTLRKRMKGSKYLAVGVLNGFPNIGAMCI